MKSLILKDLYTISHHLKTMWLTLVFLAVIYSSFSNDYALLVCCCVLCSMMTVTTFTIDSACQWTRYALVMPLSRKDLVASKFASLTIFTLAGIAAGLVLTLASSLVFRRLDLSAEGLLALLATALGGFSAAQVMGGISIPLVFRFGTEQARILLIAAFLLPTLALFGLYQLLRLLGIVFTGQLVIGLLCASPLAALAVDYGMYRLSCRIFEKAEL